MMSRILFFLVSVATLMAVTTLNEVSASNPICYEAGKNVSLNHINTFNTYKIHSLMMNIEIIN